MRKELWRDNFNLQKKECFADLSNQQVVLLKYFFRLDDKNKLILNLFFVLIKIALLNKKNFFKKNFI